MKFTSITFLVSLLSFNTAIASPTNGNTTIDSFNKAKKTLEKEVVFDRRITFYCGASFDKKKQVDLPEGFKAPRHEKRSSKIEWEHVVPAEHFGKTFVEWRNGSPECMDNRGRNFKGRNCASKTNPLYRLMQSDLYNLYPAIGSVNAVRSNLQFMQLPKHVPYAFGTCEMKVDSNHVEPPNRAKGAIARTYLYMDWAYPNYQLGRQQKRLMEAWNQQFPVEKWECTRAKRIEKIQKNENPFVKNPCQKQGWY